MGCFPMPKTCVGKFGTRAIFFLYISSVCIFIIICEHTGFIFIILIYVYIYFITTNYSDHEFWRRKNLYLYYGCTCYMLWRNSLKVLLWLRAGSINWRAINTIYRNFTRGICVILYSKKKYRTFILYIYSFWPFVRKVC